MLAVVEVAQELYLAHLASLSVSYIHDYGAEARVLTASQAWVDELPDWPVHDNT